MNEFNWENKIPIFKNKIIINQLLIAIGIPFGVLIILLLVINAYNGLILVGGAFFLVL